jgi:hypothetical protein
MGIVFLNFRFIIYDFRFVITEADKTFAQEQKNMGAQAFLTPCALVTYALILF